MTDVFLLGLFRVLTSSCYVHWMVKHHHIILHLSHYPHQLSNFHIFLLVHNILWSQFLVHLLSLCMLFQESFFTSSKILHVISFFNYLFWIFWNSSLSKNFYHSHVLYDFCVYMSFFVFYSQIICSEQNVSSLSNH